MLKPLGGKPAFAFPVIAAAPGVVACTKYLEGKQTPGAKQLYFWSRRIPIIECECCVSEIRLLTPQVHVHVIRDVTLAEIKVSLVKPGLSMQTEKLKKSSLRHGELHAVQCRVWFRPAGTSSPLRGRVKNTTVH